MRPHLSLRLSACLAVCLSMCLLACSGTPRAVSPPMAAPSAPVAAAEAASAPLPAAVPKPPESTPRAAADGEQAFAQGLKAYQSGQYRQAEALLKQALKGGLPTAADTAKAHKHLAFIYCTSRRETLCAASFRAARAADARFALSKAEAGHPMWSKVYRQSLGLK